MSSTCLYLWCLVCRKEVVLCSTHCPLLGQSFLAENAGWIWLKLGTRGRASSHYFTLDERKVMLIYARLLQRCLRLTTFWRVADWRCQWLDLQLQLNGRLMLTTQVGWRTASLHNGWILWSLNKLFLPGPGSPYIAACEICRFFYYIRLPATWSFDWFPLQVRYLMIHGGERGKLWQGGYSAMLWAVIGGTLVLGELGDWTYSYSMPLDLDKIHDWRVTFIPLFSCCLRHKAVVCVWQ